MITRFKEITIVKNSTPEKMLNSEVQWFSESLGFFSKRDKDMSCFRIFLEILKNRKPISSDELAYKLHLSRATVVHHLRKLIAAGVVVVQDNKYILRDKNLSLTIKKVKGDLLSTYEEIENIAKEIDKRLNL